jgi:hypothetical protein
LDSSKTKADKIAIINAKAIEQKKKLDKESRKIDHDKAVFDREISIAHIIADTAAAIVKANKDFPFPFSLIVGGLLGAIGDAEIGAVLTPPLPAFKKGGTKKGDGLALFGEVGSELRINPDGKIELTPDTPTIGNVKSGTKFIDNATTMRMLANPELFHKSLPNNVNMDTTNNLLRKLVEKDNRPRVNVTVPRAVYWWKQ